MPTVEDVKTWSGRTAVDPQGEKIGKIDEIYLDRQTGEPEWATVSTGLFGSKSTFVPIQGATDAGDDVRLGSTKDQVKDAPKVDDDGELSTEEEQQLYRHYGRGDYGEWDGTTDRTRDLGLGDDAGSGGQARAGREPTGRDTSGPTTDDAMTRSEEELRVGTERREAGRVRLRKYVVTEQVTKTVPVQHEEVRIEREPITDANVDQAMAGPEISDEEHEVVLHEDVPVTEKRAVPKERVRLDKESTTKEETVSGEVRKERIETDGDSDSR
jgi:uncharacterized protein (TIGR02271 family)